VPREKASKSAMLDVVHRALAATGIAYPRRRCAAFAGDGANFINGDGLHPNHSHCSRSGGLALGPASGRLTIAYLVIRYGLVGTEPGSVRSQLGN